MATVREYVTDTLGQYGYELSKVKMDVLLMRVDADDNTVLSKTTLIQAEQAIVYAIPELLPRDDVTEGGLSLKRNVEGVKTYYNQLCARNGFVNELAEAAPTVSDASFLW
ncbi:hypothetical protein EXU85_20370 [Spirosoma sp. KCTC 42546]|uniref:DUF6706 family protein n=1 Tax=Spirosoma sp. KCTC 42546 TaxID=2520506 RepID=UPI00115A1FFA|nr:DUF6706 family protein [Spirosoma sp. KCTC 42546]QDK80835.1 hypothetical protein EXU85_20370 [Spirosoma sp. KCTC 42546]